AYFRATRTIGTQPNISVWSWRFGARRNCHPQLGIGAWPRARKRIEEIEPWRKRRKQRRRPSPPRRKPPRKRRSNAFAAVDSDEKGTPKFDLGVPIFFGETCPSIARLLRRRRQQAPRV